MVIFRIITNLFGIVTRLGFGLLWFPIFILTRHLFLTLIIIGVLTFYLFFKSDDHQASHGQQYANPATMMRDQKGHQIQVATPVKRVENGDSAFANDLYRQMTQPERIYYSQLFFWAMTNLKDGETHSWSDVDIAGSMTPSGSFANNEGTRCRQFSEVLKVHAVQQNISGLACDNGGGTWCKLKANSTPACGLGHNPGFFDSVSSSLGKIF